MPIVKASKDRVKTGVHFMLGNYALVEGAISAGCNFFGGYPITPANEIFRADVPKAARGGREVCPGRG